MDLEIYRRGWFSRLMGANARFARAVRDATIRYVMGTRPVRENGTGGERAPCPSEGVRVISRATDRGHAEKDLLINALDKRLDRIRPLEKRLDISIPQNKQRGDTLHPE